MLRYGLETKERKEASGADDLQTKEAVGNFMKSWEEFKSANDRRMKAIEKKQEDILNEENVDRLSKSLDAQEQAIAEQRKCHQDQLQAMAKQQEAIDALQLALERPAMEGEDAPKRLSADQLSYKKSLMNYVRKGDVSGDMRELEAKALTVGTDPDGGYLVTPDMEQMIDRVVTEISPIRQIASVISIGSSVHKRPVSKGGAASGWVGETGSRPQTQSPDLSLLEFPTMELYAMPAATQSLLDDARVNIEEWLAEEVNVEFAAQEGAAFVGGDGVAQPRGFTSYANVADANWTWGKIGFITSGVAAALTDATHNGIDALLDLVYAPKQAFRSNGTFVMNRATQATVRKLKDEQGQYHWQPNVQAGQPATLLGYPIVEAEDMDDIGAGNFPIAFGDFNRGYLIVDRVGVRVLRDPY